MGIRAGKIRQTQGRRDLLRIQRVEAGLAQFGVVFFQADGIDRATVIGQLYFEEIIGEGNVLPAGVDEDAFPALNVASPGELAGPVV